MKKLLALVLAIILVLQSATAVFAEGNMLEEFVVSPEESSTDETVVSDAGPASYDNEQPDEDGGDVSEIEGYENLPLEVDLDGGGINGEDKVDNESKNETDDITEENESINVLDNPEGFKTDHATDSELGDENNLDGVINDTQYDNSTEWPIFDVNKEQIEIAASYYPSRLCGQYYVTNEDVLYNNRRCGEYKKMLSDVFKTTTGEYVVKKNRDLVNINTQKVLLHSVKSIYSCYNHYAITYYDELYGWGGNSGHLGDGTTDRINTPKKLMEGKSVSKVEGNNDFMGALTCDGDLYMWGYDFTGTFGGTEDTPLVLKPHKIMSNVKDFRICYEMPMVITKDGKLFTWGTRKKFIGINSEEIISEPTIIDTDVVQADSAAGQTNAGGGFYLKSNGDLYTFGIYNPGTRPDNTEDIARFSKPQLRLTGVASFDTAGGYSIAIKPNGDMYAWGTTGRGQLADGYYSSSGNERVIEPKKVFTGVIYAKCCSGGGILVTGNGDLYGWGPVDEFIRSMDLDNYSSNFVPPTKLPVKVGLPKPDTYEGYVNAEYTIVAKSHGNGRVDPDGEQKIKAGEGILYNFHADNGYEVMSVVVDGKDLGSKPYYAFFDVHEKHTLDVYFGIITKADLFTTYPSSLITEKTYNDMYDELMWQMVDIIEEDNNNTSYTQRVIQAIKYNMRQGAWGNLKTGIEGELGANWTKDKLVDELTRQLVSDISKNDKALEELRGKLKSTYKHSDKFFSMLIKGVRADKEGDAFTEILAKECPYDKDELKRTYLGIAKSSEFKELEQSFKDVGIAITIADVLAISIEISCMNKELVTCLRDNTPEGTDLHMGLARLAKEQEGIPLIDETLKVIKKELIEKKLLSSVLNACIKVTGEWIVEEFYGLKVFEGSSVATSLGGLIMYFGSYLIGEPSADSVIKSILAVDNMLILRNALHKERFALRNGLNGKQVSDCMYVDSILYNSSLAALDEAYKNVIATYSNEKTHNLRGSYTLLRDQLTYERNLASCLAKAKTQWKTQGNLSGKADYSTQVYDISSSELASGSVAITGMSIKDNTETYYIDIPEKIGDSVVTEIGSNVFADNKNLVAVNIPETVKKVGTSSFQNASSLVRVYMHPGLTSIGKDAFRNCKKLNYVDIPVTVKNIEEGAFVGINNLAICGEKGSIAEKYAVDKGYTFIARDKSIRSIEIAQLPNQLTMGINDVLDTTGLKLRIDYDDGSQTAVSKGFTCTLSNRTVGTNTVEVLYDGFATTYQVRVVDKYVPVNSIKIIPSSKTLKKGKTITLELKLTPSNASDKAVAWKSSNTKVAKVSSKGKVTAKGPGTAIITATAKDGSKVSGKATIKVPGISLNTSSLVIQNGKTNKAVKMTLTNDKIKSVKSNNKNVTVKVKGKKLYITGKKIGKSTITITTKNGVKKKLKVTVQKKAPTTQKLKVSKSTVYMNSFDTITIKVSATPDRISTGEKITVKNSNKDVVSYKINQNTGQIEIKSRWFNGVSKLKIKVGKKTKTITVNVFDYED